jgi:Asp-tRNA(Asn)/Glu-tRNA(Gln) amidotransferase A subunit family amidase
VRDRRCAPGGAGWAGWAGRDVARGTCRPEDLADPLAARYTDCWTVVANLVGLPALSVPSGRSPADGMPVGTMLMGRRRADHLLLRVGAALAAAGVDD